MDLTIYQAKYRIETPMFLNGANNKAEIRLASFKGIFRFWWRALAWERFQGDLQIIHKKEMEWFGSSDQEVGQGQLLFSLHENNTSVTDQPQGKGMDGISYLKGQGVGNRKVLAEGGHFTVRVLLRKKGSSEELEYIEKTFQTIGTFGAMGARSRKGFGSLSLQKFSLVDWNGHTITEKRTELQCTSKELSKEDLKLDSQTLPSYSAFSINTRLWKVDFPKKGDVVNVIRRFGDDQRSYRTNMNNPTGRFRGDLQILQAGSAGRAQTHPERIVFGLPHNCKIKQGQVDVNVSSGNGRDRRSSPLFIHVSSKKEGGYQVRFLVLASQFLHSGDQVKVGRSNNVPLAEANELYKPLWDYLLKCCANSTISIPQLRTAR